MEEKICPYPGLRPFNDDESIFFKGRERNIDTIIELFEQKKFMMLTGASGDGKSSLVYAGIVPHARAGLFKAKYNNWIVADFKPERTPLDNLTSALNIHFKYDDQNQLKEELSLGFSSLTKIYKNSPFFITEDNNEWAAADDLKKKQLKRKASNLLIIADQFEEFFTNSENFIDGSASVESQTVINVLLETAKIALAEDLPIYVVCTMRSDYIGQCAAFRGLPEYIGFSQFFVPRLKRKEIQQVIEEPAQLNGDKISDRLIQRLLYDISDGLDQLPILQHALNQIWKMADNGKYEMDLIHYAKVGGLPADELPPEDRDIFAIWFAALPDFKKQLFANPSLENILNAHANELLEFSYQNFIERNPGLSDKITQEQAKTIIKTTFQCLTKIDAARAVRNRMTLQEITDIINDPSIDVKMVGKVLDIFREQGNTFIKPFITSDIHTLKTHKHTVLDITHESLIRNWDILKTWAYEEFDNWSNFQDFNKQLQRWIKSGKTSGYLLPIGPLTFFENWYDTCKPNKYWLARYSEKEHSFDEKLKHTEENLNEADSFIKNSAKKLFITRTVMKYGANKILAIFGLLILFGACTYYYFDYRKKQNDAVLAEIEQRGLDMLRSNKIKSKVKADFIIAYERLHSGSFSKVLNDLQCDTLAYDIAFEMFLKCQNVNENQRLKVNPLVYQLTDFLNKKLNSIYNDKTVQHSDIFFKRFGEFVRLCAFIKSYEKKEHSSIDTLISINVKRIYEDYLLNNLNKNDSLFSPNPIIFNSSLELVLNFSENAKDNASILISKISPFENNEAKRKFEKLYAKDKTIKITWNNSITHNAGYQELGYLYAVKGDIKRAGDCLDSILIYNNNYKSFYNLSLTEFALFILNNPTFDKESIDFILAKFEKNSNFAHLKVIRSLLNNIEPYINPWYISVDNLNEPYPNLIHYSATKSKNRIYDYYLNEIEKEVTDKNDKTYKLALYYKQRGLDYNTPSILRDKYFNLACKNYALLPKSYLEKEVVLGMEGSTDSRKIKRTVFFLYPTMIDEDNYWNPFYVYDFSKNHFFLDYLFNNDMQDSFYYSKDEWNCLQIFLYRYYEITKAARWASNDSIYYTYYDKTSNLINRNLLTKSNIDSNFIYLVQANKYFSINDTTNAILCFRKANKKIIFSSEFQKGEEGKGDVNKFLLKSLASNFAVINHTNEALLIISKLYEPYYQRNTLIATALKLQYKGLKENSFVFLDTLFKSIEKNPKYGLKIFEVNAMIGGQPMLRLNTNLIKDVEDKRKPRGLALFVRGIAHNGYYFNALQNIPEYVSSSNELELYSEILLAEVWKRLNSKQNNIYREYDYAKKSSNWLLGDEENGDDNLTYITSE
jgi:hypothetical protein